MDTARSPYAVPLTELEATRVSQEEQVTLAPELRYADGPVGTSVSPFCGGGLDAGDGD